MPELVTTIASVPEIRLLPPLVVNQIAAGEVIERPASVVKELLDNALDAGATRINVHLEGGGIELIRVSDNGHGIGAEQLPLALAAHATSKIRSADDLDRVGTLGFRGEALASIASVSRLSIVSRTAGELGATRLDAEGDRVSPPRPEPGPVGTTLTVRNLFFNTPARRKFLRTPQTEQQHCAEAVHELAMCHPAVGFSLRTESRTLLDLPPDQGPRDRAFGVLGREMEPLYLEAHADEWDDARGMALWGLVGKPELARLGARHQHLFLNGRPIRDKTIQHALKEAYRGLIEPGKHPAAVLMLQMHPSAVDVNVHPAKAEVRFRDSGLVHMVVLRAVKAALEHTDLTPRLGFGGGQAAPKWGQEARAEGWPSAPATAPAAAPAPSTDHAAAQRFADYFRRLSPPRDGASFDYQGLKSAAEAAEAGQPGATSPAPSAPEAEPALPLPIAAKPILQVHHSYVVTQDEQGVVIIDQHALHERAMFEALKSRLAQGELESQRLLMPVVMPARPAQMEALQAIDGVLRRIGLVVQPIGPDSIAVQSFPTILFDRGVEPGPFIANVLQRLDDQELPEGEEALLHEILDMMACKAAIKAGDRMSDAELAELLDLREHIDRASNCPHGRPTAIRLTIDELDRRFGRG